MFGASVDEGAWRTYCAPWQSPILKNWIKIWAHWRITEHTPGRCIMHYLLLNCNIFHSCGRFRVQQEAETQAVGSQSQGNRAPVPQYVWDPYVCPNGLTESDQIWMVKHKHMWHERVSRESMTPWSQWYGIVVYNVPLDTV